MRPARRQRTAAVEALVAKARGIARAKGFDVSVLNEVDQSGCSEAAMTPLLV